MFCGDEVPAVVIDLGSCNSRFGSGGEAFPKHVYKSVIGINEVSKYYGDVGVRVATTMEIQDIISVDLNSNTKQSNINWDNIEGFLRYGIESVLYGGSSICKSARSPLENKDLSTHSLFFTESHMQTLLNKQTLAEICFENFKIPGFFVAPNAVLSGISMCKPTALIIDIGASGTSISTIVDGYVLRKSRHSLPIGGYYMNMCINHVLNQLSLTNSIKPWFELPTTTATTTTTGASKSNVSYTNSYKLYHQTQIIQDLKHWMSIVPYTRLDVNQRSELVMYCLRIPPYILPDGVEVNQSDMLCTTAEALFQAPVYDYKTSVGSTPSNTDTNSPSLEQTTTNNTNNNTNSKWNLPSLASLVIESIAHLEIELQKEVINNILITGGGSNIDGVHTRLQYELGVLLNTATDGKKKSGLALKVSCMLVDNK